jgi:hypothetical protein
MNSSVAAGAPLPKVVRVVGEDQCCTDLAVRQAPPVVGIIAARSPAHRAYHALAQVQCRARGRDGPYWVLLPS